ncbi:AlpA family transcriptional regulator [Jeongeupia wiesaeckerbachi]|uniref:helix-turn-helix transcriptional regulator n=1 Tax=Jeongeupia wiesaeckerbachi TaxID=3051218 RepID=UPI003D809698
MQQHTLTPEPQVSAPASSRILRLKQVIAITGLARSSIYRAEGAGRFPHRVKLGPNSVGWRSDEIEAWLAALPRRTH